MDKLLKEAIADAKAVRETALANAKIALEEAFAPKLQSMLAARINEEEDEMEDDEEEAPKKKDTDEGTAFGTDYLGEKDAKDPDIDHDVYDDDEIKKATSETADSDEDDMTDSEEENESLDLEAIIRELEMEAAEDAKDPEVADNYDDAEISKATKEAKEDDEEDINLDELLAALAETEDSDEDDMANEAKEKEEDEDDKEKMDEINRLKSELAEYRDAVVFLKDKINEINLLNAKLLYTNKLFKSHSLTESQKVKILESLDRTKTVREVKLVYSTLAESLNETTTKTKTKIAESLGFASKATGKTQKPIIEEGTTLANRFQTLANINKKK